MIRRIFGAAFVGLCVLLGSYVLILAALHG
jgi:hypothetical protein